MCGIPDYCISGYTSHVPAELDVRRVQESNLLGIAPTGFRNQRITVLPTLLLLVTLAQDL